MPVQQSPVSVRVYKSKLSYSRSIMQPMPRKEKKNRLVAFFYRINPVSWFNDFKDIKITLEEFSDKKK